MKRILLLGFVLAMYSQGIAQYYYLSRSLGQNPGGLNTSQELPWGQGLDPLWTVVYNGGIATPSWSAVKPLPIPFSFNGTPVSTYKVSSSGVLTFDVAATTVPSFDNLTLPSPLVPNNSICVWGLKGDNVDDKIVVRTFGQAPYRQFWVMFSNFNYGGGNPACNLYWSIVLEETTNSIYLVDQKNFITCLPSLTLGIQVNATTAAQVTGSPTIGSKATNDATPADNFYYEFVPGIQPKYDLSAVKLLTPKFTPLSKTPLILSGKFESLGSTLPQSLELSYKINGGATVTRHITNTANLATLAHPTPWKPTATGSYQIKMWVSSPDGEMDNRTTNDTAYSQIDIVNDLPSRMALLEHATQHNCGPCAALNPFLEALLTNNNEKPATAVIKYHTWWPGANNDPMYLFNIPDNASRVNYYNINGVPTAVVAGNLFSGSPGSVTAAQLDQARDSDGLFSIDINETVNATADSLTVSVTAIPEVFVNSANLKLRVAIVQDMLSFPSSSGTNGERDFPDLMRYYLPDANGINLVPLIGTPTTLTAKRFLPANFKNSVVRVVVYVQDDVTKDVYMATKSVGHFLCPNGGVMTGSVAVENASCTTDNGEVSLAVTGGSGNYSYAWSLGGSTTNTATNLAPGRYTVTVSDGADCVMPIYAVVERKTPPTLALDITPISCAGQNDGAVKAVTGGGTGTLSFAWNTGSTADEVTGLSGGPVLVTVTDETGCTSTANALLSAPAALGLTATTTPDNGTLNGTATAVATGGTRHYTYEWNTNPVQTTRTATGLASGTYSVTVRDYNQCVIEEVNVVVNSNVGIEEELALGIREFRLSPNPTQAMVFMDLSLNEAEEIGIEIQDLQGRTLNRLSASRATEHHQLLDLSRLSAGVYLMRLSIGDGVVFRKIVKE